MCGTSSQWRKFTVFEKILETYTCNTRSITSHILSCRCLCDCEYICSTWVSFHAFNLLLLINSAKTACSNKYATNITFIFVRRNGEEAQITISPLAVCVSVPGVWVWNEWCGGSDINPNITHLRKIYIMSCLDLSAHTPTGSAFFGFRWKEKYFSRWWFSQKKTLKRECIEETTEGGETEIRWRKKLRRRSRKVNECAWFWFAISDVDLFNSFVSYGAKGNSLCLRSFYSFVHSRVCRVVAVFWYFWWWPSSFFPLFFCCCCLNLYASYTAHGKCMFVMCNRIVASYDVWRYLRNDVGYCLFLPSPFSVHAMLMLSNKCLSIAHIYPSVVRQRCRRRHTAWGVQILYISFRPMQFSRVESCECSIFTHTCTISDA